MPQVQVPQVHVSRHPPPPPGSDAAFPSSAPPVLRLKDLGLGEGCLSLEAHPGEIVHVQGGSPALRLRLLALAAGHGAGGSGQCELLGHALSQLDLDLQPGTPARRWTLLS